MNRVFLIHYGELALKGKNRPRFEARLVSNLRAHLSGLGGARIRKTQGAYLVEPGEADPDEIARRLRRVSGIAFFLDGVRVEKGMTAIAAAAAGLFEDGAEGSFRVTAKRSDKRFPLTSEAVAREAGGAILRAHPKLRVDLHDPERIAWIEVAEDAAYVAARKVKAAGGLPVGSSGKLLSMISGGIDSPVASAMMLKRGAPLHFLHFHNFPYTDRGSIDIVEDLVRRLNANAFRSEVSLVNLTPVQEEIVAKCDERLRVVLYRRMMFRIAERVARRERCGGIVTGESLGQVASQTVENMRVIEAVTPLPVLRPLIGMDKEDIIRLARELGTYDDSVRPHADCCSLFVPKHPATKARLREVEENESRLDLEGLLAAALAEEERLVISERVY